MINGSFYKRSNMIPGFEGQGKETKKDENPATLVPIIIAAVAIISLAITILSANLPDQTIRFTILLSVPILAMALFIAVLYSPLGGFWKGYRVRSKANDVASSNMKKLIEFSRQLDNMSNGDNSDSIKYAINGILSISQFRTIGGFETRFIQEFVSVIRNLGTIDASFKTFKELTQLFNAAIQEYNDKLVKIVDRIIPVRTEGNPIPGPQLESYRLARSRYIAFIDGIMEWGEKINVELGIEPRDYISPHYIRINHLRPPKEL